ncbi:Tim44 domain-containing protein [Rhizobacter sp. Root1221]|uniref:Tim44 domain-containing protein n=1 Tax=Rhizobacter sp. Root1221 TaxID=1736433 RepID=UPI0006F57C56|nr:Tim44-like domain-containing protein [Rhizobacter sp. Root1221]KQV83102.1 preprotein translocase subunit Tim44 [Rhizobacter sp. Root1221]
MKRLFSIVALSLLTLTALAPDAEAKRLGGGGTSGMKRTVPSNPAPNSLPAKPTQPPANAAAPTAGAAPAAAAAAAAPKRSWMGPLAGLAAGLGIAALASHLGLGAGMGNFLTILLVAGIAFIAIRFLLARFGPKPAASGNLQFAGGGQMPPAWQPPATPAPSAGFAPEALAPAAVAPAAAALPDGFDAAGFERTAKLIFIRMQAANDVADLNDLRAFTTPEMFAAAKLDLQDRHGGAQQTDVVQLNAQVVDHAQDAQQQIVSVRFHGLIREEKDAAASPFDEVWHLVKPHDGSREWAIAGIAPYA